MLVCGEKWTRHRKCKAAEGREYLLCLRSPVHSELSDWESTGDWMERPKGGEGEALWGLLAVARVWLLSG